MGLRHYVVNTESCAEAVAESNIKILGVDVCPLAISVTKYSWRGKTSRMEWLFPSYLIISFDIGDSHWRDIGHARGVKRILGGDPERPTPIPLGVIDELMVKFSTGAFNPPPAPGPIQAGEMGRVISGSFADRVGRCEFSSKGRVQLLLSLFGGAQKIDFPAGAVTRFDKAGVCLR